MSAELVCAVVISATLPTELLIMTKLKRIFICICVLDLINQDHILKMMLITIQKKKKFLQLNTNFDTKYKVYDVKMCVICETKEN